MFCSIFGRLLGSDPAMGSGKWMFLVLAGTCEGLSRFFLRMTAEINFFCGGII